MFYAANWQKIGDTAVQTQEPNGVQRQSLHTTSILHTNFHDILKFPCTNPLKLEQKHFQQRNCSIVTFTHPFERGLCSHLRTIYFIHWHVVCVSFSAMNCSFNQNDSVIVCECFVVILLKIRFHLYKCLHSRQFETIPLHSHYPRFLDTGYTTEMKTKTLLIALFTNLS